MSSGKAQYFRWYSNTEKPHYSINFADSDSLNPFMILPGTESPENYSITEEPIWFRIHAGHAPEGIMSARNQLVQAFSPPFADDFYYL